MDGTHPLDVSPAERRRRRVREAILQAAERVFAKEGEAGLSIRRLADEIDYSPAAIYKYFGSKTELVDELKEAFFANLLGQVDTMRDAVRAFPAMARDCVSAYVRTALKKPHHYAAAFSNIGDDQEHDEAASGDFGASNKGRAFLYLQDMVAEGVAQGHFRADLNPNEAAKSLWTASHGLALMMAHMPRFPQMPGDPSDAAPLSRDAFIDYHADLLIRGLEA